MSCDDAFPDTEEFGPFTVPFLNNAQHVESGTNNEVNYDYMWTFTDLELNTTDCFVGETIILTPEE
jgi:hypothetical protein